MVVINIESLTEEEKQEKGFMGEFNRKIKERDDSQLDFDDVFEEEEESKLKPFIKRIFDFFQAPLRGRPKSLTKFLKNNPDLKIIHIRICRQPVEKYINYFVNLITAGRVNEAKKNYNYDNIYHLFAIITFNDGRKYHLEKNEIVIMNEISQEQNLKHTDCKDRTIHKRNFKKLIESAEKDYKNLYLYSAHQDNCQAFIRHIAHKLGIRSLDSFIMQYGAKDILQDKGARNFTIQITTLANAGRRLLGLD